MTMTAALLNSSADIRGAALMDASVERPKFRHNLWTTYDELPDITYLAVSHGLYEVPTDQAKEFLKFRTYCTGHHSIEEISSLSGVSAPEVRKIVQSLADAEVLRPKYKSFSKLSADEIRKILFSAVAMWAEQLRETGIAAALVDGRLPKPALIGWLLETYHYINQFPAAIAYGAAHATGEMKEILNTYAKQETGHEIFVQRTLTNLGLSDAEVTTSIPLVSTRLIDFLMREMISEVPASALLLAGILEAGDLEDEEADEFFNRISEAYKVPASAFSPLREHMMIDAKLGHAELGNVHAHLIEFSSENELHDTVNRLHDIKHAFDLQKLEIEDYYCKQGDYIPRQFVDFFAV
jgi:pyrroloquinoline quinone (PQQ) biosynthesis protein C